MEILSTIVIQRVLPDNRLIAPHWIATWETLEATGQYPTEALNALLEKVMARAFEQSKKGS